MNVNTSIRKKSLCTQVSVVLHSVKYLASMLASVVLHSVIGPRCTYGGIGNNEIKDGKIRGKRSSSKSVGDGMG